MEIKYVDHNTIDVFHGIGWEGWARFKIAHRKDGAKLFQIKGNHFPNKEKEELEARFNQQKESNV